MYGGAYSARFSRHLSSSPTTLNWTTKVSKPRSCSKPQCVPQHQAASRNWQQRGLDGASSLDYSLAAFSAAAAAATDQWTPLCIIWWMRRYQLSAARSLLLYRNCKLDPTDTGGYIWDGKKQKKQSPSILARLRFKGPTPASVSWSLMPMAHMPEIGAKTGTGSREWCFRQAAKCNFGLLWPWPLTSWPEVDRYQFLTCLTRNLVPKCSGRNSFR